MANYLVERIQQLNWAEVTASRLRPDTQELHQQWRDAIDGNPPVANDHSPMHLLGSVGFYHASADDFREKHQMVALANQLGTQPEAADDAWEIYEAAIKNAPVREDGPGTSYYVDYALAQISAELQAELSKRMQDLEDIRHSTELWLREEADRLEEQARFEAEQELEMLEEAYEEDRLRTEAAAVAATEAANSAAEQDPAFSHHESAEWLPQDLLHHLNAYVTVRGVRMDAARELLGNPGAIEEIQEHLAFHGGGAADDPMHLLTHPDFTEAPVEFFERREDFERIARALGITPEAQQDAWSLYSSAFFNIQGDLDYEEDNCWRVVDHMLENSHGAMYRHILEIEQEVRDGLKAMLAGEVAVQVEQQGTAVPVEAAEVVESQVQADLPGDTWVPQTQAEQIRQYINTQEATGLWAVEQVTGQGQQASTDLLEQVGRRLEQDRIGAADQATFILGSREFAELGVDKLATLEQVQELAQRLGATGDATAQAWAVIEPAIQNMPPLSELEQMIGDERTGSDVFETAQRAVDNAGYEAAVAAQTRANFALSAAAANLNAAPVINIVPPGQTAGADDAPVEAPAETPAEAGQAPEPEAPAPEASRATLTFEERTARAQELREQYAGALQEAKDSDTVPQDSTMHVRVDMHGGQLWSGQGSVDGKSVYGHEMPSFESALKHLQNGYKLQLHSNAHHAERERFEVEAADAVMTGVPLNGTQLKLLFGLDDGQNKVKQAAVGWFLTKHLGVPRHEIRASLQDAAWTETDEQGRETAMANPRLLSEVFGAAYMAQELAQVREQIQLPDDTVVSRGSAGEWQLVSGYGENEVSVEAISLADAANELSERLSAGATAGTTEAAEGQPVAQEEGEPAPAQDSEQEAGPADEAEPVAEEAAPAETPTQTAAPDEARIIPVIDNPSGQLTTPAIGEFAQRAWHAHTSNGWTKGQDYPFAVRMPNGRHVQFAVSSEDARTGTAGRQLAVWSIGRHSDQHSQIPALTQVTVNFDQDGKHVDTEFKSLMLDDQLAEKVNVKLGELGFPQFTQDMITSPGDYLADDWYNTYTGQLMDFDEFIKHQESPSFTAGPQDGPTEPLGQPEQEAPAAPAEAASDAPAQEPEQPELAPAAQAEQQGADEPEADETQAQPVAAPQTPAPTPAGIATTPQESVGDSGLTADGRLTLADIVAMPHIGTAELHEQLIEELSAVVERVEAAVDANEVMDPRELLRFAQTQPEIQADVRLFLGRKRVANTLLDDFAEGSNRRFDHAYADVLPETARMFAEIIEERIEHLGDLADARIAAQMLEGEYLRKLAREENTPEELFAAVRWYDEEGGDTDSTEGMMLAAAWAGTLTASREWANDDAKREFYGDAYREARFLLTEAGFEGVLRHNGEHLGLDDEFQTGLPYDGFWVRHAESDQPNTWTLFEPAVQGVPVSASSLNCKLYEITDDSHELLSSASYRFDTEKPLQGPLVNWFTQDVGARVALAQAHGSEQLAHEDIMDGYVGLVGDNRHGKPVSVDENGVRFIKDGLLTDYEDVQITSGEGETTSRRPSWAGTMFETAVEQKAGAKLASLARLAERVEAREAQREDQDAGPFVQNMGALGQWGGEYLVPLGTVPDMPRRRPDGPPLLGDNEKLVSSKIIVAEVPLSRSEQELLNIKGQASVSAWRVSLVDRGDDIYPLIEAETSATLLRGAEFITGGFSRINRGLDLVDAKVPAIRQTIDDLKAAYDQALLEAPVIAEAPEGSEQPEIYTNASNKVAYLSGIEQLRQGEDGQSANGLNHRGQAILDTQWDLLGEDDRQLVIEHADTLNEKMEQYRALVEANRLLDAEQKGMQGDVQLEAWEMTRDAWADRELRASKYADEYLEDPQLAKGRLQQLGREWRELVVERAAHGPVSVTALDDIFEREGLAGLHEFRGQRELGVENYRAPTIRRMEMFAEANSPVTPRAMQIETQHGGESTTNTYMVPQDWDGRLSIEQAQDSGRWEVCAFLPDGSAALVHSFDADEAGRAQAKSLRDGLAKEHMLEVYPDVFDAGRELMDARNTLFGKVGDSTEAKHELATKVLGLDRRGDLLANRFGIDRADAVSIARDMMDYEPRALNDNSLNAVLDSYSGLSQAAWGVVERAAAAAPAQAPTPAPDEQGGTAAPTTSLGGGSGSGPSAPAPAPAPRPESEDEGETPAPAPAPRPESEDEGETPAPAPAPAPTPEPESEQDEPAPAPAPDGREPESDQPVDEVAADAVMSQESAPAAEQAPAGPKRVWAGATRDDIVEVQGWSRSGLNQQIDALLVLEAEGVPDRSEDPTWMRALQFNMGWGGDTYRSSDFEVRQAAGSLGMTPEELAQYITENRNESYYTQLPLVDAIWKAVEKAGVPTDARILEPAVGAGVFFVGAPQEYQANATFVGVDRDTIAARFAKALAPDATIISGSLEATVLQNNFGAVVGNVPFGSSRISCPKHGDKPYVHDYFMRRATEALEPGGVAVLVTSRGFMDRENDNIRKQIMAHSDLIGGVRMPDTMFGEAGASVVTDVLVFQKRADGVAPSYDWSGTSTLTGEDPDTGETISMNVNNFFADNPQNILGHLAMKSSAYGLQETFTERTLTPEQLSEKIGELLETQIQPGIYQAARGRAGQDMGPQVDAPAASWDADARAATTDHQGVIIGQYLLDNDNLVEVTGFSHTFNEDGTVSGESVMVSPVQLSRGSYKRDERIIRDYLPLRDAALELTRAQVSGTDEELALAQQTVVERYEAFVGQHGPVNSRTNLGVLGDDPTSAEVFSLERYNFTTEEVEGMADAVSVRVVGKTTDNVKVESAEDAYWASIDRTGRIDMDLMVEISGIEREQLVEELLNKHIYHNPVTDEFEPEFEYLSGNIVEKLNFARQAAQQDAAYHANVQALELARPKPKVFEDIHANLGASWIPAEMVREWVGDMTVGMHSKSDFDVQYSPATGDWTVTCAASFKNRNDTLFTSELGHDKRAFPALLENALNGASPKFHTRDSDGNKVADHQTNSEVADLIKTIRDNFKTWLGDSQKNMQRIEDIYNNEINVFAPAKVTGARITFPGLSSSWVPRPHQSDFVARMLRGHNVVSGHPVGAGKTFEMVAGAMKLKQIGGEAARPMIVVPNHMLAQVTNEAKGMYPAAKILAVTRADLKGANRERFAAVAKNNSWDVMVVTHSLFDDMRAPNHIRLRSIDERIDMCEQQIAQGEGGKGKRNLVDALNSLRSERTAMIKEMEAEKRGETKTRAMYLEDLAPTAIIVDEIHRYKNVGLHTSMQVAGLNTGKGSDRAINAVEASMYMAELNGGASKGFYGASATVVNNGVYELWAMMKLIRPDLLEAVHSKHFDNWAMNYATIETKPEILAEGNQVGMRTRMSGFDGALRPAFHECVDVKLAEELNLPTPEVKTHLVQVPPTALQEQFQEHLAIRATAIRDGKVERGVDNLLNVTTHGRLGAIDLRLVDPRIPDEEAGNKLPTAADNIARIWNETADKKGAQLVFLDMGVWKSPDEPGLYGKLKELLVERGVDANDVRFIHEAGDRDKIEQMISDVREGNIRVLIGSTGKMGTGTNAQERLCAQHHLDLGWNPADYEQRKGRIVRQGNKHFEEVEIFDYITGNSSEAGMAQKNKTKYEWMRQALRNDDYDAKVSIDEDYDPTYAEMMAAATGEPKIAEHAEVTADYEELKRAERSWHRHQANVRHKAIELDGDIKRAERVIEVAGKVVESLPHASMRGVVVAGAVSGFDPKTNRPVSFQDGDTTWIVSNSEAASGLSENDPRQRISMPMVLKRTIENQVNRSMSRGGHDDIPLGISVGGVEFSVQQSRLSRGLYHIVGKFEGEEIPGLRRELDKGMMNTGRAIVNHARKVWEASSWSKQAEAELVELKEQKAHLPEPQTVWPRSQELAELTERKIELDAWAAQNDFAQRYRDIEDRFAMRIAALDAAEGAVMDDGADEELGPDEVGSNLVHGDYTENKGGVPAEHGATINPIDVAGDVEQEHETPASETTRLHPTGPRMQ